jgi:hypothetical protein
VGRAWTGSSPDVLVAGNATGVVFRREALGCEAGKDGEAHGDNKNGRKCEGKARCEEGVRSRGGSVPELAKGALVAEAFGAGEGAFTDALNDHLRGLDFGPFTEKFAE